MPPARHLYVHVPFCARKCSYCDFAIAVRRVIPVGEYVRAVVAELKMRLRDMPPVALRTIYLGGGTPSKLGADGVTELLDTIRAVPGVELESSAEVTMEANPEDVTQDAAAAWSRAGINRLSIGAQSFDARTLAWMHRTHNVDSAKEAVDVARGVGFDDISLDLIFALPHDLERNWAADLVKAISLQPDHLSLYGLTVEPGTPLGKWTARGDVEEAPDESYAADFLLARKTLLSAGFEQYEVSNYAKSAKRSRHNSAYWRRVPYLGIGPSAHSFDGAIRRWNEREYEAWKTRVLQGEDPVAGSEQLTPENEAAEVVYLGLRTVEGLASVSADHPQIDRWVKQGWATMDRGRIALLAEGWLRLDSLAAVLTAARSR
jgi:oxygen-independent coproporphyrinogen-3 oxidase